jgi:hypothetical protein
LSIKFVVPRSRPLRFQMEDQDLGPTSLQNAVRGPVGFTRHL